MAINNFIYFSLPIHNRVIHTIIFLIHPNNSLLNFIENCIWDNILLQSLLKTVATTLNCSKIREGLIWFIILIGKRSLELTARALQSPQLQIQPFTLIKALKIILMLKSFNLISSKKIQCFWRPLIFIEYGNIKYRISGGSFFYENSDWR